MADAVAFGGPQMTRSQVEKEVTKSWKWLTFAGVMAMLTGAVAIVWPAVASVAIALLVGWIFIVAGVIQIGASFVVHDGWHAVARFLWGLLSAVAGIYLLVAPLEGTVTLTFVMAVFFIAAGIVYLATGLSKAGQSGGGLIAVNGVLCLLIGALVIGQLPSSAGWAIGLLVGINLIFEGISMTVLGSKGRKLARS